MRAHPHVEDTIEIGYTQKSITMDIGNKEKFLKTYANLPLGIRQEIVLVLDDRRPITWDVAFVEVQADTPLSKQILEKLALLEII